MSHPASRAALVLWVLSASASMPVAADRASSARAGYTGATPSERDRAPETTTLPGRLRIHRPNYVLPLTWPDDGTDDADAELKFQVSLKHPIGGWPLYFGYTQTAYWRWLDEQRSRPFREINFNPELWYRVRPGRLPWRWLDWLGLDFGVEHESNGEDVPASRSWNRVYARPWLEQGPWRAALKLWYRVPEEEKDDPNDPEGDDNPRIGRSTATTSSMWPTRSPAAGGCKRARATPSIPTEALYGYATHNQRRAVAAGSSSSCSRGMARAWRRSRPTGPAWASASPSCAERAPVASSHRVSSTRGDRLPAG